MKLPFCLLVAFATAAPLQAEVWIVDDDGGPGVDFTDIQPAIDVAAHGDVIAVSPGDYTGFQLSLGLSVVGVEATPSTTRVVGVTLVTDVPAGRTAVLAGLRLQDTRVLDCAGVVFLDNLSLRPFDSGILSSALLVETCADVRMISSSTVAWSEDHGVRVRDARFEVVDSEFRGGQGFGVDCWGTAGDGGHGMSVDGTSEIVAYQTTFEGGPGGDTSDFCRWSDPYGGNGGHGVLLDGDSQLVLAGSSSHEIVGGRGGYGDSFPTFTDGWPGEGLWLQGNSFTRYSGVDISSVEQLAGATRVVAQPADPYLEVTGTQQAGRQLTFRVFGPPGAMALLYLGRNAIVLPTVQGPVGQLTTRQRTFVLGPIPAAGEATFTFVVPQWAPIGFSFLAQAEVLIGPGDERLTSSVPVVIRHFP